MTSGTAPVISPSPSVLASASFVFGAAANAPGQKRAPASPTSRRGEHDQRERDVQEVDGDEGAAAIRKCARRLRARPPIFNIASTTMATTTGLKPESTPGTAGTLPYAA